MQGIVLLPVFELLLDPLADLYVVAFVQCNAPAIEERMQVFP